MNIKKMSSKALAIALSIMMLVTAVYAGFATVFKTDAAASVETEYVNALKSYSYADEEGHKLNTEQWTFNITQYGDITTDPHNPVVSGTYVVDKNGVKDLPAAAFTSNSLRIRHRRDTSSIPYYNFLSSDSAQEIQVRLIDNKSFAYGAELYYTVESNFAGKVLDIQGNLVVRNNKSGAGTIYYRVVTANAQGVKTAIWPSDGTWYSLAFGGADLNPDGYIFPAEIPAQEEGNTVGIECYVDMTSGIGVDVSIGVPAINYVHDTYETSKGSAQRYHLTDYYLMNLYGDMKERYPSTTTFFTQNDARIEYGYFTTVAGGSIEANKFYPFSINRTEYSMFYATPPKTNGGTSITGFHYQYWESDVAAQCEIGLGTGISYRLAVPYDGTVLIDGCIFDSGNNKGYVRVMKNGEQVYPNDGYEFVRKKDNKDSLIEAGLTANKGDFVEVQVFADVRSTQLNVIESAFTVVKSKYKNLPSDNIFAAAFDAPYQGKDYVGEYNGDDDTIFQFELFDAKAQQSFLANYYDSSKGKLLYSPDSGEYGYKFNNNDVYAVMSPSSTANVDSGIGTAISFTLPKDGGYDIAIGGKITKGKGTLNYRILENGEPLYPVDGSWLTVNSDDSFIPFEVSGVAKSSVTIQYAVTNSKDKTVEANLGAVTIYKRTKAVPSAVGLWTNYAASSYLPAVFDEYSGPVTKQATRYSFYSYNKQANTKKYLDTYNATSKTMSLADNSVVLNFAAPDLAATVKAGYGLGFTFTCAKEGDARVTMQPNGANTQYRILLNNNVVVDWTSADGTWKEHMISDVKVNDKIDVQFSSDADCTVSFGTPSIAYEGAHQDNNDASQDMFYSVNSFPYVDLGYDGAYKPKSGIWNYDVLHINKADGAVTYGSPDWYDLGSKKLFDKTTGAGYVFSDVSMTFDFAVDAEAYHGMSLRFISPKEGSTAYDLCAAIPMLTNEGTVKYRVMLNDEQVWPADGSWKSQKVVADKILDLPLLEITADYGDEIRIDMYLDDITATTNFSINNPYIRLTGYSDFMSPDVVGKVYALKDYNAYADSTYNGQYLVPESRWNFEYFTYNLKDNTMSEPMLFGRYNSSSSSLIHVSTENKTGVHVPNGGQVTAETYIKGQTETYGFNFRFVSPFEGEARIVGSPLLPMVSVADGSELYFRVLINDTVVWPENGEWAVGNADNGGSPGFTGMDATLKVGDNVVLQMFTTNPNAPDDGTFTKNVEYMGLGGTAVLRFDTVNTEKQKYTMAADWTSNYPVSPFWRYSIATNLENPVFSPLSYYKSSWDMWMDSSLGGLGLQKKIFLVNDSSYYAVAKKHVILAAELVIPKENYLCINGATINPSAAGIRSYARITYNGKNIWPKGQGNWQQMEPGDKITYEDIHFDSAEIKAITGSEDGKVKAGDVIRFEVTLDKNTDNAGKSSQIAWNPAAYISKQSTRTAEDKDIYGGLTAVDLDFFLALAKKMGNTQFDVDYLLNKDKHENPTIEEEEDYYEDFTSDVEDDFIGDDEISDDDDDETSSRRRKKVITVVYTEGISIWVIIGIIAGGVVLVAGIIVIIILAKKKKKDAQVAAESAAAQAVEGDGDANAENTEE